MLKDSIDWLKWHYHATSGRVSQWWPIAVVVRPDVEVVGQHCWWLHLVSTCYEVKDLTQYITLVGLSSTTNNSNSLTRQPQWGAVTRYIQEMTVCLSVCLQIVVAVLLESECHSCCPTNGVKKANTFHTFSDKIPHILLHLIPTIFIVVYHLA